MLNNLYGIMAMEILTLLMHIIGLNIDVATPEDDFRKAPGQGGVKSPESHTQICLHACIHADTHAHTHVKHI